MKFIERLLQNIWNIFLTPFLLFMLAASAILYAYLYQEDKLYDLQFREQARVTTLLSEKVLNQYAENKISQLLFLKKIVAQQDRTSEEAIKTIETIFREYLLTQPEVDQVRLLSDKGVELVRLDNRGDHLVVTPQELLQNKSKRDYFKIPKNATPGKVYISPLDLNVEFGRVELPFKPAIRFSTGVYDANSQFVGVVVINVKAIKILTRIERLNQSYDDQRIFLAGKNNDWIIAPEHQVAWASYMGVKNTGAENFNTSLSTLLSEHLAKPKRLETSEHTYYVKSLMYNLPKYIDYIKSDKSNLRLVIQTPNFHSWLISAHALEKNQTLILIIYSAALIAALLLSLLLLKRRKLVNQTRLQQVVSQRFLEAIPQAVIIFDRNGKLFFQNDSMEHLFEKTSPNELAELRSPERRKHLWEQTEKQEDTLHECQVRDKDGKEVYYFRRQSFFIQDGARTSLFGIVFNEYTRVEKARQELEESAAQIRTIIDAAPDAILVSDENGKILMSNHKAQTLFDLSYEEFLKLSVDDLVPSPQRTNHKDLRKEFYKNPRHRIMSDRPNGVQAQSPKGRIFNVEINLSPIMQKGQRNVISIIRDVTERQKIEHQLRQTQKMEALGQLTGGIAHDFNNLLTSIIGNLDLSIELLQEESFNKEEMTERLTVSVNGCLKAAKLTKRLLAFSRTESSADTTIDIGKQISDELNIIESACGKRTRIETVIKDNIRPVRIDPEDLTNAMINLATNARDAMPDGGIIFIKVENYDVVGDNMEVYGSHIPKGEYVAITFSDKGNGIEPEQLEKIFEPFYTTKPKYEGTGLGLTMVFAFVRQTGGFIKVYSEVGIGTTFKLFFPVEASQTNTLEGDTSPHDHTPDDHENMARETFPPLQIPSEVHKSNSGKEDKDDQNETTNKDTNTTHENTVQADKEKTRILLVDDEIELLHLGSKYLEMAGYKVFNASNADEAMTVLEVKPVDLVLTDVVMPGKNGFELEKDIRETIGDIPVIFCSGFPEEALKKESRFRENMILIDKPYRKQDLIDNIEKALNPLTRGTVE